MQDITDRSFHSYCAFPNSHSALKWLYVNVQQAIYRRTAYNTAMYKFICFYKMAIIMMMMLMMMLMMM